MVIKIAVVSLIIRTRVKILLVFLLLLIADQLDTNDKRCHKDQTNGNQQKATVPFSTKTAGNCKGNTGYLCAYCWSPRYFSYQKRIGRPLLEVS